MSAPHRLRRIAIGLSAAVAGLALALAAPLAASAHVSVSSTSSAPGGYARLTFSVPSESETESTVRVEVALPSDTPFSSVRTVRVPGWTAQLVSSTLPKPVKTAHGGEITEAVTKVVWTADTPADAIRPDEVGLFVLSVGPLPEKGTVYLPALQVYDSGREVFWADQASGSAEPEHPAPSIAIVAPAAAESASGQGESGATGQAPTSPWLVVSAIASVAALGVAILALGVGLRRREPAS